LFISLGQLGRPLGLRNGQGEWLLDFEIDGNGVFLIPFVLGTFLMFPFIFLEAASIL